MILFKNKLNKGFSIVELLISIAIMSIVVVVAVTVMRSALNNEKRGRALEEVEWQASFIMNTISQSLRNGTAINSPAAGVTATTTSIAISTIPAENPTVFTLTNGRVTISEAGGSAIPISSTAVTVTTLTFQNVTAGTNEGSIRVTLGLRYNNPNNIPEQSYSTTRVTTVSMR